MCGRCLLSLSPSSIFFFLLLPPPLASCRYPYSIAFISVLIPHLLLPPPEASFSFSSSSSSAFLSQYTSLHLILFISSMCAIDLYQNSTSHLLAVICLSLPLLNSFPSSPSPPPSSSSKSSSFSTFPPFPFSKKMILLYVSVGKRKLQFPLFF